MSPIDPQRTSPITYPFPCVGARDSYSEGMNENIHGERTASEPQDRSSSVAHSIEVPSEIIRKWQEIVNLLAEIMHVPSASIMRVDPPHIKVFKIYQRVRRKSLRAGRSGYGTLLRDRHEDRSAAAHP